MNESQKQILDVFQKNPKEIISLEKLKSLSKNPKEDIEKLKRMGIISEVKKNCYQYI